MTVLLFHKSRERQLYKIVTHGIVNFLEIIADMWTARCSYAIKVFYQYSAAVREKSSLHEPEEFGSTPNIDIDVINYFE